MCDGDLDTILSYISSKINKIFCDREFVGCVKEDLDIILKNENCCVLFPKLKPIFLKVLRYQAVIFDLSVFCIGSGPNQVAVVCKKAFLKEKTDECPPIQTQKVPKSMDAEENSVKSSLKKSSRVNRPTQSYYVPPAQRSTPRKKAEQENKTSKKLEKSTAKHKDFKKSIKNEEETAISTSSPITEACDTRKAGVQEDMNCERADLEVPHSDLHTIEQNSSKPGDILNSSEDSSQIETDTSSLPSNKCELLESEDLIASQDEGLNIRDFSFPDFIEINELPKPEEVQYNEQQTLLPLTVQKINSVNKDAENANSVLDNASLCETDQLASFFCATNPTDQQAEAQKTNVNSTASTDEKGQPSKIKLGLSSLYMVAETILQDSAVNQNLSTNIENPPPSSNDEIEKVIKLLKMMLTEENDYEYDEENCAMIEEDMKQALKQKYIFKFHNSHYVSTVDDDFSKESDCSLFNSLTISDSRCEIDSDVESITTPPLQVLDFQSSEQQLLDGNDSNSPPLYISYHDDTVQKKPMDCDIDNEKEEMQRALENINWKRRSLIKHIRNDNTLRINDDKEPVQRSSGVVENKKNTAVSNSEKETNNSNLADWEDMFDEQGELQAEYIGEIVKHIGCEVKVVKANHDYSAYQNAKYQDLEHVIELYDFPSTLKTQDLMQLYRVACQDATYIKWCDDTHALLVLSSPAQAQRALQIEHDIIKARPLSQASTVAALTASSTDLKPAMKRPQTSMQTARRLITTHLGTRSKLSKEEVEQERRALRDAREQRRLERQNEKDAWEGRPRNAKS